MKKNRKRIVVLGMTGILLLTGCGGNAEKSAPMEADGADVNTHSNKGGCYASKTIR